MNMPAPPLNRVPLADEIIDVRRAVWRNASGANFHLWREDEQALAGLNPAWESTPATPYAYTILGTQPVELAVAPLPLTVGTLELLTVNVGAVFNPASSATALGMFDNFSWVVKWGAIADLLRGDGQATSAYRTAFAEQRWREGVELAMLMPVIMAASIGGQGVMPVSLFDLDALYENWQDNVGTPVDLAVAGPNLVALRPVPNGVFTVVLSVARNAPIPADDGSHIQVGNEEIDAILDYAEAAGLFKAAEPSEAQMERFWRAALGYNKRLAANARFLATIKGRSYEEERDRPRKIEVAEEV